MDHDNLESLILSTIDCLTSFKQNPLNEQQSTKLISDLSNLRAFMISLHLTKILNATLPIAKKGIELFHETQLEVLQYYLNEIFKIEDPENVVNIFKISSCKIATEKLSIDMQNHKTNKLRSICHDMVKEITTNVKDIVFSREDLEYFCSSLAGSFLSTMLFNTVNGDKKLTPNICRDILHAIVYKTFQIVNSFSEQKIFNDKVTFEEKNIEDV